MTGKIIYVALGVSVLGLLILTYVSTVMEPPLSNIGDLNSNSIGKQVHVQGMITEVHKFKGGSITFSLGDGTGDIDVFLINYMANDTANISKGTIVDVIGEVDQYNWALEIIPKNAGSVRTL